MRKFIKHLKEPLTFGRKKVHTPDYGWLEITTVYLFGFKMFTEVKTFNTESYDF